MLGHRFFEGGKLPESYVSGGCSAVFNTDFRPWLKYEFLQSCPDLDPEERAAAAALACVREHTPDAPKSFIAEALAWFHSCADIERLARIKMPRIVPPGVQPQVNLYWDFYALWASFRQQYQIDLYECGPLHWWEFRRLLALLKADTPLAELRELRRMDKDVFMGRKTKPVESDWALIAYEQNIKAIPE